MSKRLRGKTHEKSERRIEYGEVAELVDAAVMKKHIMLCDINSGHFMLGASFTEGSSPSFSVIGR